ncbi:MAG: cupin domain-containing protein [Rhodospirillales bacterium]|nr:cupin domain-containing protein [Rhodospirillales bacterium]
MATRPTPLTLPAFDPMCVTAQSRSNYPASFQALVRGRHRRALGDAAGLNNFGVNLTRLEPGAASAQRHWHTLQDEFIYILEGEATLVTEAGEQTLTTGMAAGFPAGLADGHHLVNRGAGDLLYLEVGDRTAGDEVDYPDIDLKRGLLDGKGRFVHDDGTPY